MTNPAELVVGKAHFIGHYFFRNKPIPEIQTWIYVSREAEDVSGEIFYKFQDPASYYVDHLVQDPDGVNVEIPEVDTFVVDEENLELVYTLDELEQFVYKLHLEPNANDSF